MRISTGMLNDVLAQATARVQPPSDKGRRLKIYYMTQASTKPPTFVCFCQPGGSFSFFLSAVSGKSDPRRVRPEGTPVRFIVREKEREKVTPISADEGW